MPGKEFRHLIFGIVEISEYSCLGRADLDTRRFQACIDPVMAEVALLDDRDEGIDISGIVRAGGKTIFTTDTSMFINDDDSIFLLPGGLDRAIDDTGRVVALIAEGREEVA